MARRLDREREKWLNHLFFCCDILTECFMSSIPWHILVKVPDAITQLVEHAFRWLGKLKLAGEDSSKHDIVRCLAYGSASGSETGSLFMDVELGQSATHHWWRSLVAPPQRLDVCVSAFSGLWLEIDSFRWIINIQITNCEFLILDGHSTHYEHGFLLRAVNPHRNNLLKIVIERWGEGDWTPLWYFIE